MWRTDPPDLPRILCIDIQEQSAIVVLPEQSRVVTGVVRYVDTERPGHFDGGSLDSNRSTRAFDLRRIGVSITDREEFRGANCKVCDEAGVVDPATGSNAHISDCKVLSQSGRENMFRFVGVRYRIRFDS